MSNEMPSMGAVFFSDSGVRQATRSTVQSSMALSDGTRRLHIGAVT